jgi:hypothetical protein
LIKTTLDFNLVGFKSDGVSNSVGLRETNNKKERAMAVQKGGLAIRRNYEPLPPVHIENTKNITSLLVSTINDVRAGNIELRVANCIGYLAGHLIKAFEVSTIEERLVEVERVVLERKKYK